MPSLRLAVMLFEFVLLLPFQSWAGRQAGPRLRMVVSGDDNAWHCPPTGSVAGGTELLRVDIHGLNGFYYPSLDEGWPQGLTLEAGRMADTVFVPDPEMRRLLNFTRHIDRDTQIQEGKARENGKMPENQSLLGVTFYFSMTIPETYIGERIYFRAGYDSEETGHLGVWTSTNVIAPCDEKARQLAQGSYVTIADGSGNFERAVQIADSLVALGWRDPSGLGWAAESAKQLNRPEAELRFMDLNYEANGRFGPFQFGTDVAERQAVTQQYQARRQELLEEISKQQR
jgi:hypothetical protein